MKNFKVVLLCQGGQPDREEETKASTPEEAASRVLGLDLVRGASKGAKPVAKIYWAGGPDQLNMVRLYTRLHH